MRYKITYVLRTTGKGVPTVASRHFLKNELTHYEELRKFAGNQGFTFTHYTDTGIIVLDAMNGKTYLRARAVD